MERIEPNRELFARSAMRRSEGYVAGSCHGGKCEWIDGNIFRVRQELAQSNA